MSGKKVAILTPGDMGHAVGRALAQHGHLPVTCLAGRSKRTRALAEAGGFTEVADLRTLAGEADLILSILPPAAAGGLATQVAEAMTAARSFPPFVDCNAISPSTARAVGEIMEAAGAPFIDAGIIGAPPGRDVPRFYASGPDTTPLEALDDCGIRIVSIGHEIGKASGLKMCYAGLTKGTWTLHTAVLVAAESLGLSKELGDELAFSQASALSQMQARVPFIPADSGRWIGEMEEIAATFRDAGVTDGFHDGAAEIFRLLARTPFAEETRENMDRNRTLDEAVAVYARHLEGEDG